MRAWPTACALAALFLAGCASNQAPLPETASAAPDGANAEWTGCDGAVVALKGPHAVYRGTVPPGWESDGPVNTVQVEVLRCERVSWGPFERGPVSMVLEWHGGFHDPAGCRDGGRYAFRYMLESIWFGDPELAAYARGVHGLPALAAEFEAAPAAGTRPEWAWALPGGPRSSVAFADVPGERHFWFNATQRMYWPNGLAGGAGVSWMDLAQSFRVDELDSNAATGALQAPLLHGRAMPSPEFAAGADRLAAMSARATIARFADGACLEAA